MKSKWLCMFGLFKILLRSRLSYVSRQQSGYLEWLLLWLRLCVRRRHLCHKMKHLEIVGRLHLAGAMFDKTSDLTEFVNRRMNSLINKIRKPLGRGASRLRRISSLLYPRSSVRM